MKALIIGYIAILGLFIGSFLNVVGLRIPKRESIVSPPSHCTHCGTRLRFLDLIPVVSYLFLKGRCRYCNNKISPMYTIFELLTAILFVASYIHLGIQWELISAWMFFSILIAITISDLHTMLIPNKITYPAILFFMIFRLLIHPLPYLDYVLGGVLGGGLMYLIARISHGGMGGGDVKLFALIGFVLGWKLTLLTIMLSSVIGLFISGMLMIFGLIKRKEPIPFGPFISLSAIITYFYGNGFLDWYLQLFM